MPKRRRLRLKPLSAYVAALERATCLFVTQEYYGTTLHQPNEIVLYPQNPVFQDAWDLVDTVTHEILHQTHQPNGLDEKEEEEQVKRLTRQLLRQPGWVQIVEHWLLEQFFTEVRRQKDG